MKKKDPIVTESRLEAILDARFEKQGEFLLKGFERLLSFEVQKAKEEIDKNAQKYRDQILTREDKTSAELEEHRIERLGLKNDVENLDTRVTKLEHASKVM